jgi:hypothetical protein
MAFAARIANREVTGINVCSARKGNVTGGIMTLDNIMEKETLPVGDEDKTLPTQVAELDEHIKFLNDQMAVLSAEIRSAGFDRAALIARAKECHITDDGRYKIVEIPIYPKKRVDVAILKKYQDKYALIVANIKSRIQDKAAMEIEKADVFISQADVKAVVRDKALLSMIITEPSEPERYETTVVRR